MATTTRVLPAPSLHTRLSGRGLMTRAGVAVLLAGGVALLPLFVGTVWDQRIGLAAIYGVIGLSVNVITGHAGQVSLGHQAFVGIGAFMSAFAVSNLGLGFVFGLVLAGATGGAVAALLGLVSLRVRGLYLALVTLAFGLTAEATVFNWRVFTGGGAGAPAPRPEPLASNQAYAYLCLAALAMVALLDWRLVKTKTGRAIVALRTDERVAATYGVNVTAYKVLAFVLSGFLAGFAGSLFAHWNGHVQALDFDFEVALVWVLMAVVGGLGSRAGVVIGSAFFAIFPLLLPASTIRLPLLGDTIVQVLTPFIGALLLLLTLTAFPGGIGQQLTPLRRWLAGGPLLHRHGHRSDSADVEAGDEGTDR